MNDRTLCQSAGRTIVLLPGMDGTGMLFAPLVDELERHFITQHFTTQVVSFPNDVPMPYAELTGKVRESLPVAAPFVIVAESFSGPIAAAIAACPPPGLKGIVLCCSFVKNPRPMMSRFEVLVPLIPFGVAPVWGESLVLLGRFSNPAMRATLGRALSRVSPAVLRSRLRAILSVDVSEKLAKARVPVLYLRASEDRLVPASSSAEIMSLCPSTQIVEIEGPHLLLQAAPIETTEVIAAFAAKVCTDD